MRWLPRVAAVQRLSSHEPLGRRRRRPTAGVVVVVGGGHHRNGRSRRAFSATTTTRTSAQADFTHAIVGGGVVGLAVARRLAQRRATNGVPASTVLIERNRASGMETSSRNSEVIHAGLYYGPDTLKTKLCIRGKHLLYDFCARRAIGHRRTGKWIVAQTDDEWEECLKIHRFSRSVDVPTRPVALSEARLREPDVRARTGILESPSTGIVDSHGLMTCLQADFEDAGGDCVFQSSVTGVDALDDGKGGYRIVVEDRSSGEQSSVTCETLVNSAGLLGCDVNNMVMPPSRRRTPYFAKGSYFSYSASSPKPSILVYPAPKPGLAGLGTHLTLDLQGRMRFGPDVEWVDDPTDLTPRENRLPDAVREIHAFLPAVDPAALAPDYAGIRPKLAKAGAVVHDGDGGGRVKAFQDFVIRREHGFVGFVNLLGIESPGLTSSLAIAEEVEELLYN